jgi:membrane protein
MVLWIQQKARQAAAFLKDYLIAVKEDDIIPYAHQLTLSLILAFFPFVMFLFTLVGFINLDSTLILDAVKQALPESVHPFMTDIITDVVDQQRSGLMSFSIILAIYAASGGFRAFMKGSNRVSGLKESRHIMKRYILSIIWVILFALTLVLVLLVMVFGRQVIDLLDETWPTLALDPLTSPLGYILPVLFIATVLTLFFMFGPSLRVRFMQAMPGAIFTTITWVLLTLAFRFYVDQFANYSRFYGALGALIALMIWLQLISTVLLLGVEVNAVLLSRRGIDLSGEPSRA